MPVSKPIKNQQTVGNIGLFYVCYQLSRLGWNVMPTARNAKGVDILIYNQNGTRTHTIQVKTLSKGSPVPLSNSLDHLFADFVVICRHVTRQTPECFVITPDEIRRLVHRGEKDGRVSFWLQPRDYAVGEFLEKWDRIGSGLEESPSVEHRELELGTASVERNGKAPAVDIEKKFVGLRDEWKSQRRHEPSTMKSVLLPAYQKIIGMGPAAIPFLFQELESNLDNWFWALMAITEDDPVHESIRGDGAAMAQAWLNWGKEHGYKW